MPSLPFLIRICTITTLIYLYIVGGSNICEPAHIEFLRDLLVNHSSGEADLPNTKQKTQKIDCSRKRIDRAAEDNAELICLMPSLFLLNSNLYYNHSYIFIYSRWLKYM
jgi:hypothetical protein